MPKVFALAQMQGGAPNTGSLIVSRDFDGYVLCDTLGNWGAYLFSGTLAELAALDALPSVLAICLVTETTTKWPELDSVIAAGVRTTLNTWLTARGLANIPANWTNRQVISAVFQRFNAGYSIDGMDIAE